MALRILCHRLARSTRLLQDQGRSKHCWKAPSCLCLILCLQESPTIQPVALPTSRQHGKQYALHLMSSNLHNDINRACADSRRRSRNVGVVLFSSTEMVTRCFLCFTATAVTESQFPACCFPLASVTYIALLDGGGIDFGAIVSLCEESRKVLGLSHKLTKLTSGKCQGEPGHEITSSRQAHCRDS